MNGQRLFFPGLVLVIGTFLYAQAPNVGAPLVTNYETEKYNAHSQNWVAVQDPRGVMYFGNSMGILEFDGQRWQVIPVPGNPLVRAMALGPDGTIYYGSIGDFGYLVASPTGKVSAISIRDAIPDAEQSFNDVWQAESCADGIYFLTRSRIFRFHNGKITALPGKLAPSQACVLNGTLFYADIEKGICLVDEDRVVPIPRLAGVYNGKRIAMAPFGHHELLVGRITGDFLRVDLSAFWDATSRRYDVSRPTPKDLVRAFPTEMDQFLDEKNAYLYKLMSLGPSAFAIGTIKAGIIIFTRDGKILRAINMDTGLLDNTVLGMQMDRSNDLWAMTNGGISHLGLSVPQSFLGPRNGIDGMSISACFHDGRLYVGTYQNLLVQRPFRFTLRDDLPRYVAIKQGPSEVWQFLEAEGDLMAASDSGLFRIENETAFKVPGSSLSAYCLGISRRWPGCLFVGLMGGLEVFKHASGQWALVGRMGGVKEDIRRITEDADGDLWLSTEANGLLRAHFLGGNPTEVVVRGFGPEHGLPGLACLRAICRGTTLYALSPKGLFSANLQPWNAEGPDQTRFAPDSSLGKTFNTPPIAMSDMVSDGKGGFFFNTADGVVWAALVQAGLFKMVTHPFQGLPPSDDALYFAPQGSVWLAGIGLRRVDPYAFKDYDQGFDVLIRKVAAKGRPLLFEGTHGRECAALRPQRTVFISAQGSEEVPELPYSQNALSFEFSATFYEKPETTKFQYILEGFDKDWSEWESGTFKEYTNIPEGSYRFRVRAENLYGTQGREAAYVFRILPPWYRTIWAYLLWGIGGTAALAGVIRLNTLKLRHERDHLESIVAERTQQLHDASLTDPLTGLRNRRYISEILQNEANAFVACKKHLAKSIDSRGNISKKEVFGLFMIDIDHFKQVNDAYGHDAGDQVLKRFADVLRSFVRGDDAVMRVGGEEFLVVLKRTMPEYLSIFAAKTLKKVAATPFAIGGGMTIHKTCSIGYTGFPVYREHPGLFTFEQSIMITDLGLFHAKNHGRNQAVCLKDGPQMPSGEAIIQKTATSLEFALQEGYLRIDNVALVTAGPTLVE